MKKYIQNFSSFYRFCFLSFLVVFSISIVAQNPEQKTTIKLQNVSVKDLIRHVENSTSFTAVYRDVLVDDKKDITLNEVDKPLSLILRKHLEPKGLKVVFNKGVIIITRAVVENRTDNIPKIKKITGLITDEKGEPIIGASIIVKGTDKGTISDLNGNFSIEAAYQTALQLSFIGFTTKEIRIGTEERIVVKMSEETRNLNEVIVVGYGTQKKVNLTGSVATVNADKLTIAPLASTTGTLAGRIPGLITKQESGLPGADGTRLSIRGFGAPLVIVDGIESGFNNIDAKEIESISVLKDAAAAIYGARAGDGVILVTTKRGKSDKPIITFNSSTTLQGVTRLPIMASSGQMAELSREEHTNLGKPESNQRFTKDEVALFYAGTNPDYPNTNWLKVVANDWAPSQQYNLSVRGGSDKIKYYGYLGFLDQATMFKGNSGGYERYNMRSNIDAKILDNLTAQIDISSIWETKLYTQRPYQGDFSIWNEYWNTEPFWASSLPDGRLPYGGAGGAIGLAYMTNIDLSGYNKTNIHDFKSSISLNFDFKSIKGLKAKAFVNLSQIDSKNKLFSWAGTDSYSYNYSNNTYTKQTQESSPQLQHYNQSSRQLTGQFSLNYERIFDVNHKIHALALYEVVDYYNDWISASRDGFQTRSIEYLFAGGLTNQLSDGRASEMGRQSYIGRMNYAFKSKYLMEATVRMDESAKFSKETRRGVFPSISLGWRMSEEGFLKDNVPQLENLKIRTSYSQTGKDAVGNFQYLSGYSYGNAYINGSNVSTGLYETAMANPFLTWETMTISNVGLDFSILKRSLYGEIDFFYRNREGIPGNQSASLPSTFGATLPLLNLNSINTRGFELLLGHEGRIRDFIWNVNANISWARSKWGFFDEPDYSADPDIERQNKKTGQWVDRIFGYKSDGLFTTQKEIDDLTFVYNQAQGNKAIKPGDVKYQDVNNDGLLDWRDVVEIGSGDLPQWNYGFNTDLTFKNFDLTAFFQGALGFNQRLKYKWGNNYSELMFNERWTPQNNNANGIIPRMGGAGTNDYLSDFNLKKSDYLRLKTVSLGYNLPVKLLKKANIQNLRLYIAATNLVTFSSINKYYIDPEAPMGEGGRWYPQMKTISFGFDLSL